MYKKFILMVFILLSLSAVLWAQFVTPVVADHASLNPGARSLASSYIDGQKQINLSFHEPQAVKLGEYDLLNMENCSYVSIPGHPQLPIKSVVVKLSPKSNLTSFDVNVESTTLNGTYYIASALRAIPTASEPSNNITTEPDPLIYDGEKLYPQRWFDYRVGNGIDPGTRNRITYLVIYFYPLRYIPAQRKVIFSKNATITVLYKAPIDTALSPEELDNLIITSSLLEPQAIRLAQWKNSTGIKSRVLTTDWIYDHYLGVDDPEKIRNCIKDFVSKFEVMFVTIFGDADQVPVRYAYVPDPDAGETYVPTDLYYADLDYSWDDNGDGLYADLRYDVVDAIPDVYIGRIPPSLVEYAQVAVDKIMGYQQQFEASQNWTQRIVLAAGTGSGDGFTNPFGIAFPFLKDYISNIVTDKDNVKLYESAGNLSTTSMASEINRGALFVNFAGHGDPGSVFGWLFYWVIPGLWWNGFGISDVQSLINGFKLPVATTAACSTARFDDTDCIGEWFVLEPDGGSIAYFGSTRIAYAYPNEYIVDGLMGEMDWRIYQAFFEGYSKLGEMWGVPITRYIQSHGLSSIYDEKTVMELALLGDPTLDIGVQYAHVYLESREDTGATTNLGSITFDGTPYYLPTDISKEVGSYQATYNPASGYRFDHWETSGGVSVTDANTQTTTVTVSGDGTLRAIYTANNPPTTPTVISPNGGEIWSGTHDITWTASTDPDGDPITYEIEYSSDSETTWHDLASGISGTSYPWDTTTCPDSANYLTRIRAYDGKLYSYWDPSDNIFTVDNTPPSGSISINAGATHTTSVSVTLTLTYSDTTSGVGQVRYSNDGVWDTEPWETPSPTKAWTLTSGDGTKTVYYQVKDNAGLVSPTYSDTIILDTTPPTGSIIIAGGATYTTTTTVTLTLSATDATSGVAQMRLSNDGIFDTEPWEAYATSKSWTLLTGDGVKTVFVQFKDNVGLISPSYSDTIILDTTAPTIITHTPTGTDVPITTTITVTFSEAMDKTSAQSAFSISPSVLGSFSWSDNKMSFMPSSNLAYDTTYSVTIDTGAEDLAGNHLQSPYSWQFSISAAPVHDLAVTDVYTDPSAPTIGQETTTYVNVKNEGNQYETDVPVKAYVDGSQVGSTQYVTLSPGESSTLSFSWTPDTAKTYSVKGEIGVVPSETDTADNSKTISVTVYAPTPDFSIFAEPTSVSFTKPFIFRVQRITITVTSLHGFSSPVTLSGSWVGTKPRGLVYFPRTTSVTPPPGEKVTCTFTVLVLFFARNGSYTLQVNGTSGTLTHHVDIAISVA